MIIEGLKLTFLGMVVVYAFLLLLVMVVHLTATLLKPLTEKEMRLMQSLKAKKHAKASHIQEESGRIVAIIAAAISVHRSRHPRY